jgi:hypothetical protein
MGAFKFVRGLTKTGKDKLPVWKQRQRQIAVKCETTAGSAYYWKIPRRGNRIPNTALIAMNDHGGH